MQLHVITALCDFDKGQTNVWTDGHHSIAWNKNGHLSFSGSEWSSLRWLYPDHPFRAIHQNYWLGRETFHTNRLKQKYNSVANETSRQIWNHIADCEHLMNTSVCLLSLLPSWWNAQHQADFPLHPCPINQTKWHLIFSKIIPGNPDVLWIYLDATST